jgi:hypothetical protein
VRRCGGAGTKPHQFSRRVARIAPVGTRLRKAAATEDGGEARFWLIPPRDPAFARFASFGGFESAEARSAKAESVEGARASERVGSSLRSDDPPLKGREGVCRPPFLDSNDPHR